MTGAASGGGSRGGEALGAGGGPPGAGGPPRAGAEAASDEGALGGAAIRVSGLVKDYCSLFGLRRHRALDGISFAVERGEVVGLVGPNGGGKSTTMKCLLGFLRPTRGEIAVLGHPPGHLAARRDTGYLPEESPFPGVLTGASGLDFYGALAGLARRDRRERAAWLLERVGLAGAARQRLATYSKGMLRRFGLAQAVLAEPALLILDEPTSGLDPLGARELRGLIAEERARGASVLLSSHHLSELEHICDRVVLLHRGAIALEGRLQDLLPGRGAVGPAADRAAGAEALDGREPRTLEELFFAAIRAADAARGPAGAPAAAEPAR
jgi:ABC-2 type transport system ATP-binding protein